MTAVGAGAGSHPALRPAFLRNIEATAKRFDALGIKAALRIGGVNPGRVPYLNKDPRGYAEFRGRHKEHSALGLANTQRGVQLKRPTIYRWSNPCAA